MLFKNEISQHCSFLKLFYNRSFNEPKSFIQTFDENVWIFDFEVKVAFHFWLCSEMKALYCFYLFYPWMEEKTIRSFDQQTKRSRWKPALSKELNNAVRYIDVGL